MQLIYIILIAIPIAAGAILFFVRRSNNFKRLMKALLISGIVFSLFTAFFVFTNATVPIAPYETGKGAWTPVLTGVAVGFLEGFAVGVLIASAIGIPYLIFQQRRNKTQPPSVNQ
jgi:formate hydrogenlyase subunit 3/multisubunit Na+/H+ antiporter MnhD subunit